MKNERNRIAVVIVATFILIVILCITLLYIKNFKNNYNYKYEPKETWQNKQGYGVSKESTGVHSINVNQFVIINQIKNNLENSRIEELEKIFGIKLLKSKNIEYKYFDVFSINENDDMFNSLIANPAKIKIKISNYEDFKCTDFVYPIGYGNKKEVEEYQKCMEGMQLSEPDKKLNLSIIFATQYATKEQLENFTMYLADFPDDEVEIYNSKKLNTQIFISRWNEYVFVYNNIFYILDNSNDDYSKEELLKEIESMKY